MKNWDKWEKIQQEFDLDDNCYWQGNGRTTTSYIDIGGMSAISLSLPLKDIRLYVKQALDTLKAL